MVVLSDVWPLIIYIMSCVKLIKFLFKKFKLVKFLFKKCKVSFFCSVYMYNRQINNIDGNTYLFLIITKSKKITNEDIIKS